jgi:hypothetical protein
MKFDTRSEELFAAICERHGYQLEKLATRSEQGLKTADFSVQTPNGRIIAEVEELTPNLDDLRQIREMKEIGRTTGGDTIGARARAAIRHAATQLRDHYDEAVPMIAVLYDNVRTPDGRVAYPMFYVEPHHIDAAMYGDRVAYVPLAGGVSLRPDRSGGGRTTTKKEKTYLSAVAVISDWDDETLLLYHNHHAAIELPPQIFSDDKCRHFWKGSEVYGEPWKWHGKQHP